MSIYSSIAQKIIEEQETIMGSVALEQAKKVSGLTVDWPKREIAIEGNGIDVIEKLVEQYRNIFGQASVEACKEAVSHEISQIPTDQVPNLLR